LQLYTQAILLVALLLGQFWVLDKFEHYVLDGARKEALSIADGVLNGLNILMIYGFISIPELHQLYLKKEFD
jgi:hypothetical protein